MKKFIYESDFKVGPDATKKQIRLFSADLEYAISEGYEYIQPKEGPVFRIESEGLISVDITEEELQEANKLREPEQVELDPNEDYCVHCHNLMLIDEIINNTLKQTDNITPQQADTMLKLAHLRNTLEDN